MSRFQARGPLRYSRPEDGSYKLIVEVDNGIVQLARALVPKAVRLNVQRYAPHISVVRREVPVHKDVWGSHEGEIVEFFYSPIAFNDDSYYWILAFSEKLHEVRVELGLERLSEYSRPPDGTDAFHITIGNLKSWGR